MGGLTPIVSSSYRLEEVWCGKLGISILLLGLTVKIIGCASTGLVFPVHRRQVRSTQGHRKGLRGFDLRSRLSFIIDPTIRRGRSVF